MNIPTISSAQRIENKLLLATNSMREKPDEKPDAKKRDLIPIVMGIAIFSLFLLHLRLALLQRVLYFQLRSLHSLD